MGGILANAARRILVGAAFLAICSVVGLTVPGPKLSADENDAWTLTEADGRVLVQPAGETAWSEAVPGSVLAIGSSVRTGESGAAILTNGGDELRVLSSSEVLLAEPEPSAGILTRIVQRVGTLLYKIAHRPSGTFRVDTPYLAVVVKGTEFGVSVSGEGASVSVSQGVVSVSRAEGGPAASVSAGQKASTSAEPGAAVSVTGESSSSSLAPAEATTDVDASVDAGGTAAGGSSTGGSSTGGSSTGGSSTGGSTSGGTVGGAVGGLGDAVGGLGDAIGGVGDGLGGAVGGALGGVGGALGGLGGALGGRQGH